jgi:hypothetical protein
VNEDTASIPGFQDVARVQLSQGGTVEELIVGAARQDPSVQGRAADCTAGDGDDAAVAFRSGPDVDRLSDGDGELRQEGQPWSFRCFRGLCSALSQNACRQAAGTVLAEQDGLPGNHSIGGIIGQLPVLRFRSQRGWQLEVTWTRSLSPGANV